MSKKQDPRGSAPSSYPGIIYDAIQKLLEWIRNGRWGKLHFAVTALALFNIAALLLVVVSASRGNLFRVLLDYNDNEAVLIPASRLWCNTGFQVRSGKKYELCFSGSVNTSLGRLVAHQWSQIRTPYRWVHSPEQATPNLPGDPAKYSERGLIFEGAPFGALLLYVAANNSEVQQLISNPRAYDPDHIWYMNAPGANSWVTATPNRDGVLCAIVNDIYLDKGSHFSHNSAEAGSIWENLVAAKTAKDSTNPRPLQRTDVGRHYPNQVAQFLFLYNQNLPDDTEGTAREYIQRREKKQYDEWLRGEEGFFYDDNVGAYLLRARVARGWF